MKGPEIPALAFCACILLISCIRSSEAFNLLEKSASHPLAAQDNDVNAAAADSTLKIEISRTRSLLDEEINQRKTKKPPPRKSPPLRRTPPKRRPPPPKFRPTKISPPLPKIRPPPRSPSSVPSPVPSPNPNTCSITIDMVTENFQTCIEMKDISNRPIGTAAFSLFSPQAELLIGFKASSTTPGWVAWGYTPTGGMIGTSAVFAQSCGGTCVEGYSKALHGYAFQVFGQSKVEFSEIKTGKDENGMLTGTAKMPWPIDKESLGVMMAAGPVGGGIPQITHLNARQSLTTPRKSTIGVSQRSTRRHGSPTQHPKKPFHCTTTASALPEAVEAFMSAAMTPSPGLPIGATVNSLVYLFGIKVLLKGLTWEGVLSSWFLGTLSYAAFGPGSYFIVCLYFIVGSLVTKLKLKQKQLEGIAEARSGRRSIGSVLGSGFAGIICAALALSTGDIDLYRIGFIASFASKLADTTSSEVGKAYGKTTYLITSLKRVPRGTEGAVSAEGTVAGIVAAAGVAAVAAALGQVKNISGVGAVVVASLVANLLESYIGASVQGKVDWLTNDVVNGLQISVAAALAVTMKVYFGF